MDSALVIDIETNGYQIVTGHNDGNARLWSLNNERLIKVQSGHNQPITSVKISKDNNFVLTGSVDGQAKL